MPSTAGAVIKKDNAPALNPAIFGVKVANHQLLRLAYDSYLADRRRAAASTKTRGEVSGGGKKPWRQKGTGRARVGSNRNPIWRGGGIAFGPRGNQNFIKSINAKAKKIALRQALSLTAADGVLKVLNHQPEFTGKTKDMASFLSKQVPETDRVLLVVDAISPAMERSVRNLPGVDLITARYLSVYKLLNADSVIVTPAALGVIESWLGEATSHE